jgi:hypothetical protein
MNPIFVDSGIPFRFRLSGSRLPRPDRGAVVAGAGPDRGGAVAGRVRPLSSADRADHRANRAARPSGEAVAATEKIFSLFEPHTDIIVKGGRDVQYGHKLNLTTGRSGLILDLVIEAGNPADSERFLPLLKRHIASHGGRPDRQPPTVVSQAATNLAQAKALGVRDAAFHKKADLRVMDMVKSNWSIASCATSESASNPTSRV